MLSRRGALASRSGATRRKISAQYNGEWHSKTSATFVFGRLSPELRVAVFRLAALALVAYSWSSLVATTNSCTTLTPPFFAHARELEDEQTESRQLASPDGGVEGRVVEPEDRDSPLVCSLAVGDLQPEWFHNLGEWQKRYGRDSTSLSKHFYEEVFLEKLAPVFGQALLYCPCAVLEVLMNGVLHVDLAYSAELARLYLKFIFAVRDKVVDGLVLGAGAGGGGQEDGAEEVKSRTTADVNWEAAPSLALFSVGAPSAASGEKSSAAAAAQPEFPPQLLDDLSPEEDAIMRKLWPYPVTIAADDDNMLSRQDRRYQLLNLKRLMVEWYDDIAYVYPKLFSVNGERLGPPRGSSLCFGQKFYVYDTLHPSLYTPSRLSCLQGQWGTEVLMKSFLENSDCRTKDPEEADWFYVPLYATCRYVKLNEGVVDEAAVMKDMDQLSSRYIWEPVLHFLRESEYYHRQQGQDHIFLFADGQGPRIFDSYEIWSAHSVFLSPESTCPTWGEKTRKYLDVRKCLSPWKDIVIPGHTDYARIEYMKKQDKPSEARTMLLTFHGRAPGKHVAYSDCRVRGKVMQLEKVGPGVDVGGFVPDYLERKGDSHFCLVPAGTSPWTNHLYESLYTGCVPVILSDEYEVAFAKELPWERFSVKWPESLVGEPLYKFLHDLAVFEPGRQKKLKEMGRKYSCFFNWYSTSHTCSPYALILRRLAVLKERRREDAGVASAAVVSAAAVVPAAGSDIAATRSWTVDSEEFFEKLTSSRSTGGGSVELEVSSIPNISTSSLFRRFWNHDGAVIERHLQALTSRMPSSTPTGTAPSHYYFQPWDSSEALDPELLRGLQGLATPLITTTKAAHAHGKGSKEEFLHLFRETRFKNFEQEASNFTWLYPLMSGEEDGT